MPPYSARHFRLLAGALTTLALSGCLAGPGTALGGPIGIAPDTKASELLPAPDSTRGDSFVLFSNRRDLLDATRLQLNSAARAYARLFGERPDVADVRLTSDRVTTTVALRIGRRTVPPVRVSLTNGPGAQSTRVALVIVQVVANEWLSSLASKLAPNGSSNTAESWTQDARIPLWLRLGVLEGVAENGVHDLWLSQLGRTRESLTALPSILNGESCDADCQRLLSLPTGDDATSERLVLIVDGSRQSASTRPEGRQQFVAASYSLVQFFSRREGAQFVRSLVAAPIAGQRAEGVFGSAKSFSADVSDVDRQWRVWLATFAYASGS